MTKSNSQHTPHPHPIVEWFINNTAEPHEYVRALRSYEDTLDPKSLALLYLREVVIGKRSADEANSLAEKVYTLRSDIDLHLLFLVSWVRALSNDRSRFHQMQTISREATSLLREDTPREVRAWVLQVESYLCLVAGDTVRSEELVENALSLVDTHSSHYPGLYLYKTIFCLIRGMGGQIDWGYVNSIPSENNPLYFRIHIFEIVDFAIRGRVHEACAAINRVQELNIVPKGIELHYLSIAYATLQLMTLDPLVGDGETGLLPKREDLMDLPWVRSTLCLAQGRPEESLKWSRKYFESYDPKGEKSIVGFDEYSLIRSELSCRNEKAARSLLLLRRDRGSEHYIDNLFWMRCELLAGNKNIARKHFKQLIKEVESNQARSRLDYELKLSCELAPTTLLELATEDSGLETQIPSAPKQTRKFESRKSRIYGVEAIIHSSPTMSEVVDSILQFANVDTPVFISGETGTGKELIAKALHESGPRASEPFLAVNCATITETLIESELFGHRKGAFTDARAARAGLFVEAGRGTLFLDEIGEISPRLQVALLRVLETGDVRSVGGTQSVQIKCRVVTATNVDLSLAVKEGRFREDLMYRLKRLEIDVPSLRERKNDIPVLAQYFLDQGRKPTEKTRMSEELLEALTSYSWPGNVRELRNTIERMRILNSDKLHYELKDVESKILSQQRSEHKTDKEEVYSKTDLKEIGSERSETILFESKESIDVLKAAFPDGNSQLRRLEKLYELFNEYNKLQLTEVASMLNVSKRTASRYLSKLSDEGIIVRVKPTPSPPTFYYEKVKDK